MEERKLKYIQFNNGTELISSVDFQDWEKTNHVKLYDPFRLYPIPPFLSPDDNTKHQTLILIKWLPWTNDAFINILVDKILVITDVSPHMQEYYTSMVQKSVDMAIEQDFKKAEMPTIDDLKDISDLEEEILGSAPESLEELTELLNSLVGKKIKKVLH